MNLKYYFPVAALCLALASCNTGKQQTVLTAGIDLANLDTTNLLGTDFYRYACGGWIKNNPLTDEYSQYGSFTVLAENNRNRFRALSKNWPLHNTRQALSHRKWATCIRLPWTASS